MSAIIIHTIFRLWLTRKDSNYWRELYLLIIIEIITYAVVIWSIWLLAALYEMYSAEILNNLIVKLLYWVVMFVVMPLGVLHIKNLLLKRYKCTIWLSNKIIELGYIFVLLLAAHIIEYLMSNLLA